MRILLALGGNALLPPSGRQDFETYEQAVRKTAKSIASLVWQGHNIAITHGNGSQVGNLLLQQESACRGSMESKATSFLPMDVLGAETQGQIGYLLQRELRSLLPEKEIFTIVTQVLIDPKDEAFGNPTKPVGPFYVTLPRRRGWVFRKEQGMRGRWRRVVPSPRPLDILEKKAIQEAFARKAIVISCGGGGIPVARRGGRLEGVEAVIDKDLTGALLASLLRTDLFLMLTDVEGVYLNYGKCNQKLVRKLGVKEAKRLLSGTGLGEGSMKPKVEAAAGFVSENPGRRAVIASLADMERAIKGAVGTEIV